jgi:hypothetical protein
MGDRDHGVKEWGGSHCARVRDRVADRGDRFALQRIEERVQRLLLLIETWC